ncbi:unnamed protein product, partial [Staurois parvus]
MKKVPGAFLWGPLLTLGPRAVPSARMVSPPLPSMITDTF